MLDFLSQVTKEFGVSEASAHQATGGMLEILKKNADKDDFVALLAKLPGAAGLLEEAPAAAQAASSSGGLGALGALSALSASGLDLDDIPRSAKRFSSYAKSQAGEELLQPVLKNAPDLKAPLN